MDWIVFADDLGAHPSTTQHLIAHLPESDRIFWFDSIGMRSPSLRLVDFKRLVSKLGSFFKKSTKSNSDYIRLAKHITPKVIPFHMNKYARKYNNFYFKNLMKYLVKKYRIEESAIITTSPVVALYDFCLCKNIMVYYKLDEYRTLPGVDNRLIEYSEPIVFNKSALIFATASNMLPEGLWRDKSYYLPQGVDYDHFSKAPLEKYGNKVLGFFGLIAEWIDFELIKSTAKLCPDWTFEFIGPKRYDPPGLSSIPNIKFLPPIPYDELPLKVAHWNAAWIPFLVNDLTIYVNPLKAREYLTIGLPTLSTPLPEVDILSDNVEITDDAHIIKQWLENVVSRDSFFARKERRETMMNQTWKSRSEQFRDIVVENIRKKFLNTTTIRFK